MCPAHLKKVKLYFRIFITPQWRVSVLAFLYEKQIYTSCHLLF